MFQFEIEDLQFRKVILVQLLIFLHNLNYNVNAKAQGTASTNTATLKLLTISAEQESWIAACLKRTSAILSSGFGGGEGRFLFRLVRWILRNEKNWVLTVVIDLFHSVVTDSMEDQWLPLL